MKKHIKGKTILFMCLCILLAAVLTNGCKSTSNPTDTTTTLEEHAPLPKTSQTSNKPSQVLDQAADVTLQTEDSDQADEAPQADEPTQDDGPAQTNMQIEVDDPNQHIVPTLTDTPSTSDEPTNATEIILTDPVTKTDYMLGTVCSVRMYDSTDEKILDKVFARISELEKMVSSNDKGTEIDAINAKAGIEPVAVSNDTYELVVRSLEYARLSEGRFDPTIGPIIGLWRIGFPDARVPSQTEIEDKLQYVDYRNVEVNSANTTVFLKESGMKLDMGAIAKGFITDEVVKVLTQNGVKRAIIDLGGNVFALGAKNNESLWTVGVQNPIDNRGEALGSMKIENKSVVTSGVYERYLVEDGVNYHHILSPFNGYPYNNELAGVTIISDFSIDGDALSTTVFTLGLEEGMKFVEDLDGVEAVFVTHKKKVYVSSGLKNNFRVLSPGYTLVK